MQYTYSTVPVPESGHGEAFFFFFYLFTRCVVPGSRDVVGGLSMRIEQRRAGCVRPPTKLRRVAQARVTS